jgi:hypothetical protein
MADAVPLSRLEREQFYLASELGAVVHRCNAAIATAVPFATVVAFTSGQALPAAPPPTTVALPEPAPPPPEPSLPADLTAAVAALVAGFADLDAAVQKQIAALNAALNAVNGVASLQMQQAASNIGHITSNMVEQAEGLQRTVTA